jgi:hypothetical protein
VAKALLGERLLARGDRLVDLGAAVAEQRPLELRRRDG